MMYCPICQYSWCWTCGLPNYNHWFHNLTGGVPCNIINSFIFGFETGMHWILRILIAIGAIVLSPLVGYLYIVGCIIIWAYRISHTGQCHYRY